MGKFNTGQTVATRGIACKMEKSKEFQKEISDAFSRYLLCDWGDLDEEDSSMNDAAVETGDDRIFAKYNTSKGPVYIITEWDRSATTVLFANEY